MSSDYLGTYACCVPKSYASGRVFAGSLLSVTQIF